MNTFVATIDLSLAEKLRTDLETQGFTFSKPPYTLFAAQKQNISLSLYTSGKLTVQGKGKDEFIEFYLEPEILKSLSYTHPELEIDLSPRIGSDEAGKGDFFGPLCIAAVYSDGAEMIKKLLKIGVRDSKTVSDSNIHKLAIKIKATCPHEVVRIFPQKYNELYTQFLNLNNLLAWGHGAALGALVNRTSCTNILVDQFATRPLVAEALKKKGVKAHVTQRTKAESDPVVAAASVLARAAFLDGMDRLSQEAGITLPKGASKETIKVGRELIKLLGQEALGLYAKLHFKTTTEL